VKTVLLVLALCWTLMAIDRPYTGVHAQTKLGSDTSSESQFYDPSLAAMNEPRLADFANDRSAQIYRVTIYPSLVRDTIAVRVEKQREIYSLYARRLERGSRPGVGKLVQSKNIHLSAEDSMTLDGLIGNLKLFQMSTNDDVVGSDGELWVVEGVWQGQYRLVTRWAPPYDAANRGLQPFVAFCNFLVRKSKLSVARLG
jgi:hypothetical protein